MMVIVSILILEEHVIVEVNVINVQIIIFVKIKLFHFVRIDIVKDVKMIHIVHIFLMQIIYQNVIN